MGKAVLVINMPESCDECPLENQISFAEYEDISDANICKGCGYINFDSHSRPSWCPLKIPEKLENVGFGVETRECGYIDGFNYCIDKILNSPVCVDSFFMEEKVRNSMKENGSHVQYSITVEKIQDVMRAILKERQYQLGEYVIPLQPIDPELIQKYKRASQLSAGSGNEVEKTPE